jgi:hypothetical protein
LLDACGEIGGIGFTQGLVRFEDEDGRLGEGLECYDGGGPVNGAVAGPKVFVFLAVVVVDVYRGDAGVEGGDGFGDAYRDVRVAEVEADPYGIQMADAEYFEQVVGGGGLAEQVLDQEADAEGMGEGAEVFKCGDGVFQRTGRPAVFALAEVEDEIAKGNELGGFEGTPDLVHGVDAAGFFGV